MGIIYSMRHCPGLHIILRIINGTLDSFHGFVSKHRETDTDEFTALRLAVTAAQTVTIDLYEEQRLFEIRMLEV